MPQTLLTDGVKSIPIDKLPPEAWTLLSGEATPTDAGKRWSTVAWLHRCVDIRANALSRVPWAIMQGDSERWTWQEPEAPADLTYLQNIGELLYLTEAALTLTGTAYWMKERNRVRVLNLRWLAPSTMRPKWDTDKGLVAFERTLGKDKPPVMLTPDEVVYFALPNPLHETAPGPSPAQAVLSSAGVLMSVDAYASGFFDRGAIKATLLTIEGNPPAQEIQRLETWWKRFFRGEKTAWETAAVRAGVTPQVVGEGLESLTNSELTNEKRQDIATGLGIPHSLVFSDAANYATAQQDEINLLRYTIVPQSGIIERALNRQLFAPLGLRFQFLPEEMDAFQEDENQRAASLNQLVTAGVPLLAAMGILGYDLSDDERAAIEQGMAEKEAAAAEMRQLALSRPQPSPNGNTPPPQQATDRRAEDMTKWQRKAINALRAGKSAAVTFDSEYIDPDDADYIAHALQHALTAEEVKAAFELLPFLWEGYP